MRLEFIDRARGLLALAVVLHHIAMNLASLQPTRHLAVGWRWAEFGGAPIVAFLVISGYSLALRIYPEDRWQGFRKYLEHRVRRILPAYYAALVISLLLALTLLREPIGSHWDYAVPVEAKDVLAHLFLLHNYSAGIYKIDYPLWSIAVEFQVYILLPLLILARQRVSEGLALAALTVAPLLALRFPEKNGIPFGMLYLGTFFMMGVLARRIGPRPPLPRIVWAVIAAVTMALAEVFQWDYVVAVEIWCAFLAALYCATSAPTPERPGRPDFVLFLGKISYSLYLIHAPVIELLWRAGFQDFAILYPWTFPLYMAAAAAASIAVAVRLHRFAEAPYLRWKDKPLVSAPA